MSDETMPIRVGYGQYGIRFDIPMYLLNEEWARNNHGQTLARLKERDGLGPCEAMAIIEKRQHHRMDAADAIAQLKWHVNPMTAKLTWDMVHRASAASFRRDRKLSIPDEQLLIWWRTHDGINKGIKKQYEDDAVIMLRSALQIEGFEIL